MLRTVLLAASLALPLAAIAADEKKPSSQQQRMASCNKDAAAKELKGEARKQFVSACLSGAKSETASQQMTQQQVYVARDDHEAQALRGVGARALGHPLAEIKSDVHVDRIAPALAQRMKVTLAPSGCQASATSAAYFICPGPRPKTSTVATK